MRNGPQIRIRLHRLASNTVDDRSPLGGRRLYIDRTGQRIAVRMLGIVLISDCRRSTTYRMKQPCERRLIWTIPRLTERGQRGSVYQDVMELFGR